MFDDLSATVIRHTPSDSLNLLLARIKRPIPDDAKYLDRLSQELEIIDAQKFVPHFLRVLEILDLTRDIPHITRGSAGSSLVCYLLGITDVDPVAHDIPLARFMNPLRDDLPDIDIDYGTKFHKEVLQRIYRRWPGRAARLSNYVKYRDKSAKKEALKRVCGIRGKATQGKLPEHLVPIEHKQAWQDLTNKLLGKKRCISKHPGGVVVFDQPPARSLIIEKDNQILLDKHEIEDLALLKVDVLSNRGLSVLWDCAGKGPFEYVHECDQTLEMLSRGDSIGIIQGESPVMRRTLRALKPQTVADLTLATALIRPAALTGREKGVFFREWIGHNGAPGTLKHKDGLIFDEDAIHLICDVLGVSTFEADWYRRAFVKRNEEVMFQFLEQIGDHPKREEILYLLSRMDGFGLCKAHAVNLGQLIYAQAYEKTHNPQRYWLAVLQNACSMYRPWVHVEGAKRAGWRIQGDRRPWKVKGDVLYNDDWQVPLFESHWDQLAARGFWTHNTWIPGTWFQQMGNLASFCGVIATHRQYHKGSGEYVTFATVGTGTGEFLEVILPHAVKLKGAAFVEGMGKVDLRNNCMSVTVNRFEIISLRDHKDKYG
jgi:DNA polymerase III alpha subunit